LVVDHDAEQRVYNSDFLKSLSSSHGRVSPQLPAGWRKVTVEGEATNEGKTPRYEITLDLSPQVLSLSVPEELEMGGSEEGSSSSWFGRGHVDAHMFPSFAEADLNVSEFAPAAALALKAKQFDDGLYAGVEMAADAGSDRFPARRDFVLKLLAALAGDSSKKAAALLTAAARLAGQQPPVSAAVAQQANDLQQEFLADQLRSKVLGFYTWNEDLARIFWRDRMLQTPIDEATARPLAVALAQNNDLLANYTSILTLAERLTNPLAWDDLRQPAAALKDGHTPHFSRSMSLFPPSEAHETNLIKELYGDTPIPAGFNLADEMVKRLRAGSLDLKPQPNSGWYDYQTYALEPLALPERMPEGEHLKFDESYRKELVGLLKALLALTRETHIKQLEIPVTAQAPLMPPSVHLYISPDLSVEPLATYYLRRARAYRFVRQVLQQTFGAEALAKMQRLTAGGPMNLSLGAELDLMEALFLGAYLRSCEEIGMTPEPDSDLGKPQIADTDRALLGAWIGSVPKDPDLGKDIRMMVPIFFDEGRGMTKVWVVLGIATKPLSIDYVNHPTLREINGPDGKLIKPQEADVDFVPGHGRIAYIVSAEVYVKHLLNRSEFRQLCDQKKTYKAILSSLN
jgi:hypothetical protein